MREPGGKSFFAAFFGNLDYIQIGAMLLLLGTGLIFIHSTGIQVGTDASRAFFGKQLQWIIRGTMLYLLLAALDYRNLTLRFGGFGLYVAALLLLVGVLLFGKEIFGARRWLDIGPLRLQPSEIAKLAVICVLANIFSAEKFKRTPMLVTTLSALVVALPFLLIAVEPDLGSALILLPIFGAMLFCFGIKWRYVLLALLAVAIGITFILVDCFVMSKPVVLREYQATRIKVFFNPRMDIRNRGNNAYQAMNSVGSGGWSGKGIGRGTQNELGFLPQTVSNNDFIFSVLAEETGFCGAVVLLGLYSALLYSILRTAFLTTGYGRYLVIGIGTLIFCHIFINIGMNIGIAPITGLPLPLVSYGGSFTLTAMMMLGIVQSVYRTCKAESE